MGPPHDYYPETLASFILFERQVDQAMKVILLFCVVVMFASGSYFIFRLETAFGYGVLIAVGTTVVWTALCFRQIAKTRALAREPAAAAAASHPSSLQRAGSLLRPARSLGTCGGITSLSAVQQ